MSDYDIEEIRAAASKLLNAIADSPTAMMLPKEANDAAWELYHLLFENEAIDTGT